jgi:DNA polymerase III sliding clamp (beta) subunit (PCNA family)
MPEIKLYVATFSEAVQRCASVAPNKGVAFDKSHGIMLEYSKQRDELVIRSTDLIVSYSEIVNDVHSVESEGDFTWRVPSSLLAGIVRNFPLDGDMTMRHDNSDGDDHVHLKCGRRKAKLRLAMDVESFPEWVFCDESEGFLPADGLGERLKQVGWATDKTNNLLMGVHFDGKFMSATDKYKLVRCPFELALGKPVTVSLAMLSGLLAGLPGRFTAYADDTRLYLAIGKEIRITTQLLDGVFPDISKIPDTGYKYEVQVSRSMLQEMIQDQLVLVKNERFPRVQLTLSADLLRVALVVDEVGDMEDSITVNWPHDRFHIEFTPDYIIKALSGTTSSMVTFHLNSEQSLICIKDEVDYVAWVQPRSS